MRTSPDDDGNAKSEARKSRIFNDPNNAIDTGVRIRTRLVTVAVLLSAVRAVAGAVTLCKHARTGRSFCFFHLGMEMESR